MKRYKTEFNNDLDTPGHFKTIDLSDEPKIDFFSQQDFIKFTDFLLNFKFINFF